MRVYPGLEIIDTPFEGTRQINVALFTGGRHALVDTGVAGCPTATILPALEELGVGAVDLHLVINLHAHADHIGGNGEVFTASGELTTFAAHAADAPAIEDHHTLATSVYGLRDPQRIRALLARCGAHVPVQRVLQDGDEIDLKGLTLRVIHAPGHTAGNIALYEPAGRALVQGESVMGAPVAGPDGLRSTPFGAHPPAYRRTLEALRALDFGVCISSHRPLTDRAGGLAEIEASLAGLEEWEAACRRALAQGAAGPAALAAAAAAEGGYAPSPRHDRQVAAWLEGELGAGRATRGEDGTLRG
jgi:glyoxylase-like metal-dependent hydrolase (beta-lactamase superfamily II)